MPEAIVALGEGKRVVGRLRFESDGRRQHSQFEYADEWLAASDRFALSPGLPLREGSHYNSGKEDRPLGAARMFCRCRAGFLGTRAHDQGTERQSQRVRLSRAVR